MKFSENLNKIFTPLRICNIFNIDIYIHWSWWMMFTFMLVVSPSTAFVFVGLFFIVTLHELGHCLAAKYCDINVDSIMLYMIGGVARIRGEPTLKEEIFITICGPLVNLLLIPVFYILVSFSETNYYLQQFSSVNLSLLLFNLIPAFPLDGGRLLRAGLGLKFGYEKGTRWAVSVSNVIAVALGIFGLMTNHLSLVIIAMFLYYVSQEEIQNLQSLEQVKAQNLIRESQRTIAKLHEKLEEIRENG